jgi:hypothetical protein
MQTNSFLRFVVLLGAMADQEKKKKEDNKPAVCDLCGEPKRFRYREPLVAEWGMMGWFCVCCELSYAKCVHREKQNKKTD